MTPAQQQKTPTDAERYRVSIGMDLVAQAHKAMFGADIKISVIEDTFDLLSIRVARDRILMSEIICFLTSPTAAGAGESLRDAVLDWTQTEGPAAEQFDWQTRADING